ncbi:MAG: zinc-dependent alcohol dehydrogenase [Acidothermaceae bacterium]
MRAFVINGPGLAEVREVANPEPQPGEVVVDVERAGLCGTDVEFFTGHMSYLHTGQAQYPIRIGHEWVGVVARVGEHVDPAWVGRRVTADTMLGCGSCQRCLRGRQHLCTDRYEIGIRNGWPGALAEQVRAPVKALHVLPNNCDPILGALVEPGGNALRAVRAAALSAGERLLVVGPGTIGLLVAEIARAQGIDVHVLGATDESIAFAQSLGFAQVWRQEQLPSLQFEAVIDASNGAAMPAFAVEVVEPGGRVVYIGLSGEPSLVDSRMIALKDLTILGILSASGGLAGTIEMFADGTVDPRPLVAATIGLGDVAAALGGQRKLEWGDAPKIQVDPRL